MDSLVKIESKIHTIRDLQVMIDSDIAALYEVETKRLSEQVKRNIEKFPDDFMFQLTRDEFINLKSQNATSSWGGTRKLPFVFTEQGVYMIATVLKSQKATQTSISIMRTFTKLKNFSLNYGEIVKQIDTLENKYDKQFQIVFEALKNLLEENQKNKITQIGFIKGESK